MRLHTIALNNIRRRKMKMIFLVVGLSIAVSTVATLLTISRAMNADIAHTLDEFGANIVIVPKADALALTYGGLSVSGVAVDLKDLHGEDARKIRTIKNSDNISIIAPKLLQAAKIGKQDVLVVGVDFPAEQQLKKWWRINGRKPVAATDVLIGADVQKTLKLDEEQPVDINGTRFTVAGVLEPTGSQDDGIIFINLGEAQQLFAKNDRLSLIEVAARCNDCPIEEIVRQTAETLPGAKVVAIRQTIESKMEAMHRFEQFSVGISAVVLLVAALIVVANMTASVNERTREIGIFRAIGFRQRHVMNIILSEALLLSVVAGLLGYGVALSLSLAVVPLLTVGAHTMPLFSPALLALSVVVAVTVGTLASIRPAYKAARLDPTSALKAL